MRWSLALAALFVACAASTARAERGFDPEAIYHIPVADAATRGAGDALVTIVEFSDFSCRFCRLSQTTLRDLELLYGDDLRVAFRHHPLDPQHATLAAEAAEAARVQGRFWAMHDRLFSRRAPMSRALVMGFARDLGLDTARFARDLDSHRFRDAIIADVAFARRVGISGTPTFFINGRPVRGAQQLGVFVTVIDQELARAKKLVAGGTPRAKVYEAAIASGYRTATAGANPPDVRGAKLSPTATYPVALGPRGLRRGPDDAPVTVVVMSDFECPFCGRNVATIDRLRRACGKTLRISVRPFPLTGHPHARLAAEAAVAAAAQGKFWPYHDLLFAHQQALTRADLERYARGIGLDMARFVHDLDNHTYLREIVRSIADASALGVRSTPTLFVNGSPIRGAKPYDVIKAVVDARLSEARALIASGMAPADVYHAVTKAPMIDEAAAPAVAAPIVLDDIDFHIAALLACKSGQKEQAAHFYENLRGERRRLVHDDCKKLGVALPP